MKFCTIAPGPFLRHVETSDVHLVLPQVSNVAYVDFYIERRKAGDTIILDNGVYEGQFDEEQLVAAIDVYNPQMVVLPDKLMRPFTETLIDASAFYTKYSAKLKSLTLMLILQGSNIFEACDSINYLTDALELDYKDNTLAVGLPRAFATNFACPTLRVQLATYLRKELHYDGYLHAFGMADGDLSELSALSRAGVDSCDSSCAVWRGYFGYGLTSDRARKEWREIGTPVNFDTPCPDPEDPYWDVIYSNQQAINDAIKG